MNSHASRTKISENFLITLIFLLFSVSMPSAHAQLADGNYIFSNSDNVLQFTITEGGSSIQNVSISAKSAGRTEKQTGGEFMQQGGMEWYQFQTEFCNYSFDVPNKTLKLERYDCKDKKIKGAKITLKKN
jgi:hypothetical protein